MGRCVRSGEGVRVDADVEDASVICLRPPSMIRLASGAFTGFGLGFALGLGAWALLSLVQVLIMLIWAPVEGGLVSPLAMILVCAAGGAVLGWWNERFDSAPHPMAEVIAQTRARGGYDLDRPVAALGSFLMPLALGAPLGPEAGLSGFLAAGGTAISQVLHKIAFGKEGECLPFHPAPGDRSRGFRRLGHSCRRKDMERHFR